jgi:membrane fusion protein
VTLFRPPSLLSRQQSWLGSIQVMQPVGLRWLVFGVLATVAAAGTLLFFGEYTRKARLTGVLVPDKGLIRIVPPVASASVLSMVMREGLRVRAGEVLATLRVEEPSLNPASQLGVQQTLDARARSLDEATRQTLALRQARERALQERMDALRRELAPLDAQAALLQQRLTLSEKDLARVEALGREQFVSAAQVQARQEALLGLQAEGAAIARQRQALQREWTGLEADRRELPLQAQQRLGEIERDRAAVTEAAARSAGQAATHQLLVRAPADGVVTALVAEAGQAVTKDAAMASLVPAGAQLQAQLYAPSSALGFIQPGQRVLLRLQAFPYQKYGLQEAQVLQVAQAPLQPTELAAVPQLARPAPGEPLYRVTVRLAQQQVQVGPLVGSLPRPLLAGMQVDADVLLEKRRLIEWLFEPVLGWARRV